MMCNTEEQINNKLIDLKELVIQKGSLIHPEVLAKSQEIDELIIDLIYKKNSTSLVKLEKPTSNLTSVKR